LGYFCQQPPTIPYFKLVSQRSIRSLRYWAGASVATYASSRIGQPLMLPRFASTRWNWRSSHPTSSWPLETQRCRHCYRKTHTIPIVFPLSADPVGGGFVDSLARPGGNATGFMLYEYTIGGKWLELLKEIAPNITRVAVLRDPASPSQIAQFGAIQTAAPSLRVEVIPVNVRDASEIERAIANFAGSANGGLIPTSSAVNLHYRDLIIALTAKHKLPAIYWDRFFVTGGGLISYGPDLIDNYRRAAGYIDRILKGAKPAEMPVQAATKYEMVINLKTAKALGLTIPQSLLASADEVIE